MDWDLDGPPLTVRVGLAVVATTAMAATLAWSALAWADGRIVQAWVAAGAALAALPLARAATARVPADRLSRDAAGRWSLASIGAVAPPAVVLDGGSWVLLACRPVAAAAGRRVVWTWAAPRSPGEDPQPSLVRWAALRRLLLADAQAAEAGR